MDKDQKQVKAEDFLELIEAFDKAEQAIKEVELEEQELVLTPINQIRYGFKHLTQALKGLQHGDVNAFQINLEKAKGHCRRSFYDARDVELTFHVNVFQEFIRELGKSSVSATQVIPEYADWLSSVARAKKFLGSAPLVYEDKDERYNLLREHLEGMRTITSSLVGAQQRIADAVNANQRLQEEIARQKDEMAIQLAKTEAAEQLAAKNLFVAKVGVVVGALAILAAIAVVVFDEPLKQFGKALIGNEQKK